jgi:hypothetical protein
MENRKTNQVGMPEQQSLQVCQDTLKIVHQDRQYLWQKIEKMTKEANFTLFIYLLLYLFTEYLLNAYYKLGAWMLEMKRESKWT